METVIKMITAQIFSGRWLLTMAAANGLLLLTGTLCWQACHDIKPFMDPGALLAVYTMVFMAYFQKPSDQRPAAPVATDPVVPDPTVEPAAK